MDGFILVLIGVLVLITVYSVKQAWPGEPKKKFSYPYYGGELTLVSTLVKSRINAVAREYDTPLDEETAEEFEDFCAWDIDEPGPGARAFVLKEYVYLQRQSVTHFHDIRVGSGWYSIDRRNHYTDRIHAEIMGDKRTIAVLTDREEALLLYRMLMKDLFLRKKKYVRGTGLSRDYLHPRIDGAWEGWDYRAETALVKGYSLGMIDTYQRVQYHIQDLAY